MPGIDRLRRTSGNGGANTDDTGSEAPGDQPRERATKRQRNADPANDAAGKDNGEQVTLNFWSWSGKFQTDFTKIVISEFEKMHPNIKVKYMTDQGGNG